MRTLFTKRDANPVMRTAALCLLLILIVVSPVTGQDGLPPIAQEQCTPILDHLWTTASGACVNKPTGFACNGGAPPAVEPSAVIGAEFARTGALIDVAQLDAIDLPPIQTENVSIGLTWLRLPDEANATLLAIGDVTLYDVTPPGFLPWTNSLVQTSPLPPTCPAAPMSAVIVQTPAGVETNRVFNGISVALIGTMLIRTTETETQFIMISGIATVFAGGSRQQIIAGQMTGVPFGAAGFVSPGAGPRPAALLDPAPLRNLPVALFDRPLLLPQPGYLSTGGQVNLRTHPDIFAAVLRELPAGEVLTLLGTNPAGDWYHVQLDTGETGWVFGEVLVRNVGEVSAVYEATPLPPQRLGELGSRGRVRSQDGANLRRGPDTSFAAIARVSQGTIVDLIGRSPYGNGWLKVNVGGTVGWMSPFTIDTIAFLEALPIDWSAPAFPTPTPVPGLGGNAFPDPLAPDEEG